MSAVSWEPESGGRYNPPRLDDGSGTSRQEPVQLAKTVTAFLAVRQQLKQRRVFFPRRKSHLISLGQFAHNNTTFEDQKPQNLGKPAVLGKSSHQLTKSEAILPGSGSLGFDCIHLTAFLVNKKLKAEESFFPVNPKVKFSGYKQATIQVTARQMGDGPSVCIEGSAFGVHSWELVAHQKWLLCLGIGWCRLFCVWINICIWLTSVKVWFYNVSESHRLPVSWINKIKTKHVCINI